MPVENEQLIIYVSGTDIVFFNIFNNLVGLYIGIELCSAV